MFAAAEAGNGPNPPRLLFSDPLRDPVSTWRFGRTIDLGLYPLLPPLLPGKIIGIGRSYAAHADELGNAVPQEPLIFLKAPSAVIGPNVPIVLPPESSQVEFEGEIGVFVGQNLRRPSRDQARAAILGITAACDVTARDLQKRDATFARGKSFDTFCPLGPALRIKPDLDDLEVETRVNGVRRQYGRGESMLWDVVEMVRYVATMMTLEAGDLILTGTPAGVGALVDGDLLEVEVKQVGVLTNPVEAWRQAASSPTERA